VISTRQLPWLRRTRTNRRYGWPYDLAAERPDAPTRHIQQDSPTKTADANVWPQRVAPAHCKRSLPSWPSPDAARTEA